MRALTLLFVVIWTLIAACSSGSSTDTPAYMPTPAATSVSERPATSVPPTATTAPATATEAPSATPVPATETPIPATATPVPSTATPVPLPPCELLPELPAESTNVLPPAADLSESLAGFLGVWEGYWGNTNASSLVVAKLGPTGGSAIYTFASNPSSNMALVVQPDGSLKSANGAFAWVLNADGTLSGSLSQNGQVTGLVTMTRCQPAV